MELEGDWVFLITNEVVVQKITDNGAGMHSISWSRCQREASTSRTLLQTTRFIKASDKYEYPANGDTMLKIPVLVQSLY